MCALPARPCGHYSAHGNMQQHPLSWSVLSAPNGAGVPRHIHPTGNKQTGYYKHCIR